MIADGQNMFSKYKQKNGIYPEGFIEFIGGVPKERW